MSLTVWQGNTFDVDCPLCQRRNRYVAPYRLLGWAAVALKDSERVHRHPIACRCAYTIVCTAEDDTGDQWSVTIEEAPPHEAADNDAAPDEIGEQQ